MKLMNRLQIVTLIVIITGTWTSGAPFSALMEEAGYAWLISMAGIAISLGSFTDALLSTAKGTGKKTIPRRTVVVMCTIIMAAYGGYTLIFRASLPLTAILIVGICAAVGYSSFFVTQTFELGLKTAAKEQGGEEAVRREISFRKSISAWANPIVGGLALLILPHTGISIFWVLPFLLMGVLILLSRELPKEIPIASDVEKSKPTEAKEPIKKQPTKQQAQWPLLMVLLFVGIIGKKLSTVLSMLLVLGVTRCSKASQQETSTLWDDVETKPQKHHRWQKMSLLLVLLMVFGSMVGFTVIVNTYMAVYAASAWGAAALLFAHAIGTTIGMRVFKPLAGWWTKVLLVGSNGAILVALISMSISNAIWVLFPAVVLGMAGASIISASVGHWLNRLNFDFAKQAAIPRITLDVARVVSQLVFGFVLFGLIDLPLHWVFAAMLVLPVIGLIGTVIWLRYLRQSIQSESAQQPKLLPLIDELDQSGRLCRQDLIQWWQSLKSQAWWQVQVMLAVARMVATVSFLVKPAKRLNAKRDRTLGIVLLLIR